MYWEPSDLFKTCVACAKEVAAAACNITLRDDVLVRAAAAAGVVHVIHSLVLQRGWRYRVKDFFQLYSNLSRRTLEKEIILLDQLPLCFKES